MTLFGFHSPSLAGALLAGTERTSCGATSSVVVTWWLFCNNPFGIFADFRHWLARIVLAVLLWKPFKLILAVGV